MFVLSGDKYVRRLCSAGQGEEMCVYFGGRSYKKQRESAISSNMPLRILTSIDVSQKCLKCKGNITGN